MIFYNYYKGEQLSTLPVFFPTERDDSKMSTIMSWSIMRRESKMKLIELLPPEYVPIYLKYCGPFLGPGHGLHACLRLFLCVFKTF